MLTTPEKILFVIALLGSLFAAVKLALRIGKTIAQGQGEVDWGIAKERLFTVILKTVSLQPVFRLRFWPSLYHGLVAWGFIFFLLVNLVDILGALIPGFHIPGTAGDVYRLAADLFSVGVLTGMTLLLIRRFIVKPKTLTTREDILLHPKARHGIRRDSAIVGGFILLHVSARFLGESMVIAKHGGDIWQPFANLTAGIWQSAGPTSIEVGIHVAFWLAIGSILAFIPYFLYSKHLHLVAAPLNFLLKPNRLSPGALNRLDFDDENIEQFGATHIEDLGWEQVMDAYACIMCDRCQEVCPAYNTGKVLSPAALEINKRYFLNLEGAGIAKGEQSKTALTEFAITPEAIWACTACGACNDICPVGNEPMRDIIDIRRALVLMENDFPEQLQTAFRGMERALNPWNIPPAERLKWADGLNIPTIADNPEAEVLWWVGCAPATDALAQKTARAFATILNQSGTNYAVLGEMEQCTGDAARRAGNEFLFNELATANVELLNEIAPKRIITTCPHCLHTLKNEYPAFGGHYEVVHHSQLINELVNTKQITLTKRTDELLTFHDPCYLGRQNDIIEAPRQVLQAASTNQLEMPHTKHKSFCCGAGGAQMWKEEQEGDQRVNHARFSEAAATGADTLAVGCPFCLIMLSDAAKDAGSDIEVKDIAELIAANLDE